MCTNKFQYPLVDVLVLFLSRFLTSWTVSQASLKSFLPAKNISEGKKKRFWSDVHAEKNLPRTARYRTFLRVQSRFFLGEEEKDSGKIHMMGGILSYLVQKEESAKKCKIYNISCSS